MYNNHFNCQTFIFIYLIGWNTEEKIHTIKDRAFKKKIHTEKDRISE